MKIMRLEINDEYRKSFMRNYESKNSVNNYCANHIISNITNNNSHDSYVCFDVKNNIKQLVLELPYDRMFEISSMIPTNMNEDSMYKEIKENLDVFAISNTYDLYTLGYKYYIKLIDGKISDPVVKKNPEKLLKDNIIKSSEIQEYQSLKDIITYYVEKNKEVTINDLRKMKIFTSIDDISLSNKKSEKSPFLIDLSDKKMRNFLNVLIDISRATDSVIDTDKIKIITKLSNSEIKSLLEKYENANIVDVNDNVYTLTKTDKWNYTNYIKNEDSDVDYDYTDTMLYDLYKK
jgi:hypothetical protein